MADVEKHRTVIPVASPRIQGVPPPLADILKRHDEWALISVEERRRRSEEARLKAAEERIKVREAQTVFPATPMQAWDIFAERMGWPVGYLAHLAQPYCTCEIAQYDGGWEYCDHARDLWTELRHG